MGMLDRIKRKQFEGFKDFVQSMEITEGSKRQHIFITGVLEDPIYMMYVMKNLKTFKDFLELPSEEIEKVLDTQEQMMMIFAKSLFGIDDDSLRSYEKVIPRHFSKLRDEISYLKEVSALEQEGAKSFIVKVVRKLQKEERINGFRWMLPPNDIFYEKHGPKEGEVKIYFESGVLAAEGQVQKGRRIGTWKHFYDSGKLLAQGDYEDGLKDGFWQFFYSTGSLKSEGKYKLDLKQGPWKEWDRKGEVSMFNYLDGVKEEK